LGSFLVIYWNSAAEEGAEAEEFQIFLHTFLPTEQKKSAPEEGAGWA